MGFINNSVNNFISDIRYVLFLYFLTLLTIYGIFKFRLKTDDDIVTYEWVEREFV